MFRARFWGSGGVDIWTERIRQRSLKGLTLLNAGQRILNLLVIFSSVCPHVWVVWNSVLLILSVSVMESIFKWISTQSAAPNHHWLTLSIFSCEHSSHFNQQLFEFSAHRCSIVLRRAHSCHISDYDLQGSNILLRHPGETDEVQRTVACAYVCASAWMHIWVLKRVFVRSVQMCRNGCML